MPLGLLLALPQRLGPAGHQLLHLGRHAGAGAVKGRPFAWQPLPRLPAGGWLGDAYLLPLGLMIWGVTVGRLLPESLMWLLLRSASLWMARMASAPCQLSGSADLNWSWAETVTLGDVKRRGEGAWPGSPRGPTSPKRAGGEEGTHFLMVEGNEHVLEVHSFHPVAEV